MQPQRERPMEFWRNNLESTSSTHGEPPQPPTSAPLPLNGLQNTMLAQRTADELVAKQEPATARDEKRAMLARFRLMFAGLESRLPRRGRCGTPPLDE